MDRSFRELLVRLDRISGLSGDVRQKFRLAVSIVDTDVEMSATRARTILEHVAYTIHNKRSKNPFKGTLEGLLTQIISEGAFPKRLEGCAQMIKSYGNVGAHGTDHIKPGDVARSLDAVLEILEWFAQEHRSETPDSGGTDSSVLTTPRSVRQSGQFKTLPSVQIASRPAAFPPPIRSSPSPSGEQRVVNLPTAKAGLSGGLAMNLLWGALGALACAAVLANLGEVVGACLFALGTEDKGG